MRIALFAPYLPAPALTGGRIRIHQLTRALADEHEVTLFCAAPRRELEQANTQEALQHFSALHLQMNPLGYLPELMLPQKRLPRRVVRSSGWALRRAFQKEHHEKPFDVGVVEHSYAAKIALDAQLPFVRGILFLTYNILRVKKSHKQRSRIDQVLEWAGKLKGLDDFDGVVGEFGIHRGLVKLLAGVFFRRPRASMRPAAGWEALQKVCTKSTEGTADQVRHQGADTG